MAVLVEDPLVVLVEDPSVVAEIFVGLVVDPWVVAAEKFVA
jgi:hypothetical protein